MDREPQLVDLPCTSCGRPVTVTVRKAVERGVAMAAIRAGRVGEYLEAHRDSVKLPLCGEHRNWGGP